MMIGWICPTFCIALGLMGVYTMSSGVAECFIFDICLWATSEYYDGHHSPREEIKTETHVKYLVNQIPIETCSLN